MAEAMSAMQIIDRTARNYGASMSLEFNTDTQKWSAVLRINSAGMEAARSFTASHEDLDALVWMISSILEDKVPEKPREAEQPGPTEMLPTPDESDPEAQQ